MSFTPYVPRERLESGAVQSSFRNQVCPLVQATCGAAQLHQGCSDAIHPLPANLTLPDGRLNAGTHLPLLARRYRYLSVLGEGASAQVLLVEDTLRAGRLVTVKVMKRQHTHAGHREARALRFVHTRLYGGTPAPGIVQLLDTFSLGAHFCLVLERMFPRLLDWVAESAADPLRASLPALRKLAHQLLTSVAFMHAHGVVHADIKPDNLLVRQPPGTPGLAVVLIDLGGALSTTETATGQLVAEVQTLPYRAPEVALGVPSGAAVDEWSVGVVLAEAALKRPLFPAASPMELVQAMAAQLGPLPGELVEASALGQRCDLSALVMLPPPPRLTSGVPPATLAAILGSSLLALPLQLPRSVGVVPQALRELDPCFADLVLGLLHYDPKQRTTAKAALTHPFFARLTPLTTVFAAPAADGAVLPLAVGGVDVVDVVEVAAAVEIKGNEDEAEEEEEEEEEGQATVQKAEPTNTNKAGQTVDGSCEEVDLPAASAVGEAAESAKRSRRCSPAEDDSDGSAAKRGRRNRTAKPWWIA